MTTTRFEVEDHPDGSATVSRIKNSEGWAFEHAIGLDIPAEHRNAVGQALINQEQREPAAPMVTNERIERLAQHLFRQYEGDRPAWEGIEGWERVHWRNAAAECLGIGLGIDVADLEPEGSRDGQ